MSDSLQHKAGTKQLPFLGIQHNVVQHYRLPLFRLLKQRFHNRFALFADQTGFSASHKGTSSANDLITPVRNIPLLGGRLLWQTGCFRQRVRADLLVVSFNLRILSNYPILFTRWLLKKPSLLWGHITGRSSLTTRFGFLQLLFAKGLMCYTDSQCELFHRLHPRLKISTFSAPNSCVAQADCWRIAQPEQQIRDIVYVGRLIEDKKPQLLLEGFIQARKLGWLPSHTRLVLVGSGPMEQKLRQTAQNSACANSVVFTGHVDTIDRLREIYSTAFCSINPGYIGLLVIQSYAFGVPVFAAQDEFHSPEIEACHRLNFGGFFRSNSTEAIAQTLKDSWEQRSTYLRRQDEVIQYIRTHYTYETMADGFERAAIELTQNSSN
jgi:glycosyltransferase involved in cell wall biosynthesis